MLGYLIFSNQKYESTELSLETNFPSFNNTRSEKFCFIQFSTGMAGWLLLTFLICLYNQLSSTIHSIITYQDYRCLKNVIHQLDSKNEWLLLPASFTAKFLLAFLLKLESAFS